MNAIVSKRVDMTTEQYEAAEKALAAHPTWGINMAAATTQKEKENLVFALVVRAGLAALESALSAEGAGR